jgi:type IV pilus assembly protein PilE
MQKVGRSIYLCLKEKYMRTVSLKQRVSAFSLPELLVVIVIIGILVLIALPNLMPLISRAKSIEAQQQLIFLHSLEKTYFYSYSRYSSSLEEIGFEQQTLTTDGGNANYVIEIVEAADGAFRATATSVVDFDQDGIYNVWEIDQNKRLVEVTKD